MLDLSVLGQETSRRPQFTHLQSAAVVQHYLTGEPRQIAGAGKERAQVRGFVVESSSVPYLL